MIYIFTSNIFMINRNRIHSYKIKYLQIIYFMRIISKTILKVNNIQIPSKNDFLCIVTVNTLIILVLSYKS